MSDKQQQQPRKADDWLDLLIDQSSPEKLSTNYIRAVYTGFFGTGKTRLCATAPKTFWIDSDYGMATTRQQQSWRTPPGIRLVKDKVRFAPLMNLINDLQVRKGQLDEYETIVLDGWTSLAQLLLHEITKGQMDPTKGQRPGYDEWWTLRLHLNEIADGLKSVPYHVLMTSLAMIDKDEATNAYVGMFNILGGFRDDLGGKFDEIYYLQKRRATSADKIKGEIAYECCTEYHSRFEVKSRLAQAGDIPAKAVNATFDSLYSKIIAANKAAS